MRINLKVFRVRNGLSQEGMAERLGISRSHYSEIENGRKGCGEAFIERLQKEFGIPDSEVWGLVRKEVRKDG